MFASERSQEVAAALSPLFEEDAEGRIIGKLRLIYNEESLEYSITAWIGSHDGTEINLRDRDQSTIDTRVLALLAAVKPFTDEEVLVAMSVQYIWGTPEYSFDRSGATLMYSYSAGNTNFAAESIKSIADLVREK